jgi:TP901 family phage tail tape measure protein
MEVGDIWVELGVDKTKFQQAMTDVEGKAKTTSDGISSTFKGIGSALAGLGIATSFGAIVNVAAEFGAKMSGVAAISGATASQLKEMRAQAIQLGADTKYSASEAADGMKELAASGMNTNAIMAAMPGVLASAAASGEDVSLVAETMSSTLNSFGLSANKAGHVADVLAQSANDSAIGVQDMAYSLKYAAPVAKQLGYSLEEVGAATIEMGNAGIKGEQAGTTLRSALLALSAPSSTAAKEMENLGFKATDSTGKMKPLGQIIGELNTKMQGMTDAQKAAAMSALFGEAAVSGMMVVVNGGKKTFDDYTHSLNNCDGAAQKAANTMNDNLLGSLDQLKGSAESLAIAIESKIDPALKKITDGATNAVNALTSLFQTKVPSGFGDFKSIEAGYVDSETMGTNIGSALIQGIQKAMTKMKQYLVSIDWKSEGKSSVSNVASFAIGFISALLDPTVWIQIIRDNWQDLIVIAISIMAAPESWTGKLVEALDKIPLAGKVLSWLVKVFSDAGTKVKDFIKTTFSDLGGSLIDGLKFGFEKNGDLLPTIKAKISSIATGLKSLATSFRTTANYLMNAFGTEIGRVATTLRSKGIEVANKIVEGILSGLKSGASKVYNGALELAGKAMDAIKGKLGIHSPSKVMQEYGQMVAEGFAQGMKDNTDKAKSAATIMASSISEAFNNAKNSLETQSTIVTDQFDILALKVANTANDYQKLVGQLDETNAQLDVQKQRVELATKAYEDTVKVKGENADESKQMLVSLLDEQKAQLALENQVTDTNTKIQGQKDAVTQLGKDYKTLTQDLQAAQNKYTSDLADAYAEYAANVKKTNDDLETSIANLNSTYATNVDQVNSDLASSINEVEESYESEFDTLYDKIYNFVDLFDDVTTTDVSGTTLMSNLQDQVTTLESWQANLASLKDKGLDSGLLSELTDLGPSSASQIAALNTLTADQLDQYVALWKEKQTLAKTETTSELADQKTEMDQEIDELTASAQAKISALSVSLAASIEEMRTNASAQLLKYQKDWEAKNKTIQDNTKKTIADIEARYETLSTNATTYGKDLVSNYASGIADGLPELEEQIQNMLTIVSSVDPTVRHSPSIVDRVKSGVQQIYDAYSGLSKDLSNVDFSGVNLASAAQTVNNQNSSSSKTSNDVKIYVNNDFSTLERELRRMGVAF